MYSPMYGTRTMNTVANSVQFQLHRLAVELQEEVNTTK
jgi:hypothetical protein